DFSCTVSLSQPYIPNMIGDYTIDVRQDDWEGKDVKVHSGYFIAYGKAEIDSILLRYGIKNSKYIEEENSRAGYFNEGTEVFMAQYKANNDVNIIDASAARGQNAIEDAMREWLVENVLGADERSEADFNVAEIEANDNKHTVYSVVWLDKETKKPSRIEYRWTSKGKVVIIELYLGIRIEEKELEAALNDFNDVAKAYLERYPSDTSVNVWNYILKVTRAEYKLPTGPRTDVLTIEISNPLEEEIKQSEFNLIFTGNGQTIKIGTVGYRMEELTDDIEGKTSISFTFKGTGNAPLFAKEQCEKDISIGLISKSIVNPGAITDVPKGSRGILFLQDVVLDCGNGAKKEGIEEVEDTLGLGKSKEYPLDGIKYNVNIKSVSGEGNDASAIIDVNGELTTSLRKNEYKILKDGAVIKIGEVFTNIKGNIDETALVEFKISTVDSTLGGACSFDSEGGLTVPGYISTNANIGLDEELHYSKEERKFEDACCVNCLTAPSDKGKNIREWFCENGIGRSVLQKCDCENGACLLDLSNYPNLFIIGGKFDAQIVIGDSAHTDEIFAASDISAGLSNAIIRVSAIEKVDAQNLILVGTPDSNPLIKQFTGNVVSNYGYIGIYKNGNYAAVVVTGKTTKGVIEAAKVLAKGGLSGITHSIPEP
ncbi:hypothetical protein J4401_04345, partial [Candidatus Woesearchaeota archaeon]|nr:hypothetical protein [Candidatus Woesearchaeota archaeon]